MSGNVYTLEIKGAGLSLSREVSEDLANKVVVLVLTGDVGARMSAGGPMEEEPQEQAKTGKRHVANNPEVSVREFLSEHKAKRNPDKITTIGLYMKLHEERGSFERDDIKARFQRAAEPVPKNLSRDLGWAKKAGWIAESMATKGHYYVTNSGQTAVESGFPKELLKKTALGAGPRSKKKAANSEK